MSRDYKNTINLPETAFAMKGDLPKREPVALSQWEAEQRYARIQDHTAKRPTFIMHDGPPYANGAIHIGHAVNKILKDIVVRSKLLAGYRAPYIPGWDCHGLPIEIAVEKEVGKVGQKLDARAFRARCREYANQQIEVQRRDFKRLGILGDWENPYRTMDYAYEADILRTLGKMIANGHLQHGAKPVHWCFDCGSALAEAEIEYADKTSPAIDVLYTGLEQDQPRWSELLGTALPQGAQAGIPIWTTTPWTLPASMAVCLGPDIPYAVLTGQRQSDGQTVFLVVAEALVAACQSRYAGYFQEPPTPLRRAAPLLGTALEGLRLQHPFYDRTVPVILGGHVTVDQGTGAVHTAPAHGLEDFAVGKQYGLDVYNPVGGNGTYTADTPQFAGQFIWKAQEPIQKLLQERQTLLCAEKLQHSYPHCWRHKTPVVFRATPQWFISMERAGLRQAALQAIRTVRWLPSWGEERIHHMIANRPDWCISRQRTWGVPIAIFAHKTTHEPHPDTVAILERVAEAVQQRGVDAWFDSDAADWLGSDAAQYDKVDDVLDVWFESGLSHACVIGARPELSPALHDVRSIMYLEGSDQHRGWFHSSLLTAAGIDGCAPYQEVITHGFTVDAQGHKMSKSLGNVVAPQKVVDNLGADVLRLWVASTDYTNEMSVSDEILKRVADNYRRLRNTARFLLGNLAGFDPARHAVPSDKMPLLDRWALAQANQLMQLARCVYGTEAGSQGEPHPDAYGYQLLVQELMRFCTVDMGSVYLDVTKDRLYTLGIDNPARRAAQTAMYHVLEVLVRALAPILAFTTDELWAHLPARTQPSALLTTWRELQDTLPQKPLSELEETLFAQLFALRTPLLKEIETLRTAGELGGSLEAEVTLTLDAQAHALLAPCADELRFFFIVSDVHLQQNDAVTGISLPRGHGQVQVVPIQHQKCTRCWHHRPEVGQIAEHPELCGRCVGNIKGEAERRLWF